MRGILKVLDWYSIWQYLNLHYGHLKRCVRVRVGVPEVSIYRTRVWYWHVAFLGHVSLLYRRLLMLAMQKLQIIVKQEYLIGMFVCYRYAMSQARQKQWGYHATLQNETRHFCVPIFFLKLQNIWSLRVRLITKLEND